MKYLKNPFLVALTIIIITYIVVNIFFTYKIPKATPSNKTAEDTIKEKNIYLVNIKEKLFQTPLNINLNEEYLKVHFSLPRGWYSNKTTIIRNDDEVINYYKSLCFSNDQRICDIGHLGLGISYLYLENIKEALNNFRSVKNKNLKHLNYYLGITFYHLKDNKKAISFFEKETELPDGYKKYSYLKLIDIYHQEKNELGILNLLAKDEAENLINNSEARVLYFKHALVNKYFFSVVRQDMRNFNWTGFIAALIITIVWLIYLLKLNLYEKNKYLLITITFFLEMALSLLVYPLSDFNELVLGNTLNGEYLNDLFYCIFGIGLIEEITKILPILFLLLFTSSIKEPYEYIFYSCISALGFAFSENLIYFDERAGNGIIEGRALTSVVGHMINSAIAAYGIVLYKFRYKKWYYIFLLPVFLFLAAISHGLYDYWLFKQFHFIFFPYFLFSTLIWIIVINNSLNNSSNFNYKIKFNSAAINYYLVISLVSIIVFEYFTSAYKHGTLEANDYLITTLILWGAFIIFFASKFSKIDLAPNYWRTISFRNNKLDSVDDFTNFLRFLATPFSVNTITPQNFVGTIISIRSSSHNAELKPYLEQVKTATIEARVILFDGDNKKHKSDPNWFLIRITEASIIPGFVKDLALIKFRDAEISIKDNDDVFVYYRTIQDVNQLTVQNPLLKNFPLFGWAVINEIP